MLSSEEPSLKSATVTKARSAKIYHVEIDYADERGVQELLAAKGLLDDKYLFSAISPESVPFAKMHGTYRTIEGDPSTPDYNIFCCELTGPKHDREIRQVASSDTTLLNYLNQNGDEHAAAIAVYDRSKIQYLYGPEFVIIDKTRPKEALVAVLIIDNFSSPRR